MKKQFIYKGETFNMEVTFNTKVERTPNGKRFHTLKVEQLGSDYKQEYSIPDDNIKENIEAVEADCIARVDDPAPDSATLQFGALGFE